MIKQVIETEKAPQAIGVYSQAIRAEGLVFISGQIPLVPETGEVVKGDFATQVQQMFDNLQAVCEAAGGNLNHIVKLTIYLTDLAHFATVNEICQRYFESPYPARAVVEVSALPKGVQIEADAIMSGL
jgi:reactive intermediate/imine deaminase